MKKALTIIGLALGALALFPSCAEHGIDNKPPTQPSYPYPRNGETGVSRNDDLRWTCVDPEDAELTFDIYFGKTNPPPFKTRVTNPPEVGENEYKFDPGTMAANTKYYWKIVASDPDGGTTEGPVWYFTTGTSLNHPPNEPFDPYPEDGATDVSTNVTLSWNCTDDDGDALTFDIYFGEDEGNLPKVVNKRNAMSWNPGTLKTYTTYYWRIVAFDSHSYRDVPSTGVNASGGGEKIGEINAAAAPGEPYDHAVPGNTTRINFFPGGTSGPIWHFTTGEGGNSPPNAPSDPSPADGATNVSVDADLSWTCSDPDGDLLTYDIYFGTSSNPPLVKSGHDLTNYDPGTMQYDTKYYWKIVAKDNHGHQTSGPIWSFTTAQQGGNQPPNPPSNPNPADGAMEVTRNSPTLSWTCSDPDGDPLTYDIYFGDSSPPPLVKSGHGSTSYNVGQTLTYNVKYYWKIVAKDDHGNETSGPIWNFRAEGASGAVWVAKFNTSDGNGNIYKLDKTLQVITSVSTATIGDARYPWCVAIDETYQQYSVWVSFRGRCYDSQTLVRAGTAKLSSGGSVLHYTPWTLGSEVMDITADSYGYAYAADKGFQRILKLDRDNGAKHGEISVTGPYNIEVYLAGSVFWASRGATQMRKYNCALPMDWTGIYAAGFNAPLYSDIRQSSGDVWVADGLNDRLKRVSNSGSVTLSIVTLRPHGVAVDQSDGSVWVTSADADYIRKYSNTGTLLVDISLADCYHVAVNRVDGSVYITRGGTGNVRKYSKTGELLYTATLPGDGQVGIDVEQR